MYLDWRRWVTCIVFVFFFKQKTAYDVRISYWSSDVCPSDLAPISLKSRPVSFARAMVPRVRRRRATTKVGWAASSYGTKVLRPIEQIGRESCRERVCQYV